ncbi:MAG: hypothetical protein J7515_04975 [Caulobacter sp.]|nr:hypothetical protein [Caulobacter sp.]
MDKQTKIQFALGAGLVAAGLVVEFTLHTDVTRVMGAVIATLGVIVARRAFRRMRWGGRK